MKKVAILGGRRTPFVKAGTSFKDVSLLDLAKLNVEGTVEALGLPVEQIEELVYGTVLLNPRYPNLAREIVLRTKLSNQTNAHFVSNNCITGLVAASVLSDSIRSGRVSLGLAGGVEAMSKPTLTLSNQAEAFFLNFNYAKSLAEKLKLLSTFRPNFLFPKAPSPKEPSTGLTMGQHCELTTKEFNISREAQDHLALNSHLNASKAISDNLFQDEILPVGKVTADNLVRGNTTMEKLSALKPVFDRSERGTLTAGNSSALTDGASCFCLASEEKARELGREPIAFIEDIQFAAINPNDGLLMAPALAMNQLFEKNNLTMDQVDLFEVHEAFAAQVLANMDVWENSWYKFPQLKKLGKIPVEKLNLNGGSLALGHPFAATGGRLIISLANELKRKNLKTGVISVCAAGAMAAAVLIKRY